jgi:F-type H+-transporting ATPase subunit delta
VASGKKQIQLLARQFFKLSLANGAVSADQVGGVLAYIEKHCPANTTAVLKAYQRLIAAEVARGLAVVEHAGLANSAALDAISAALSAKYRRPITWVAKPAPSLLAGLRIRVGDDVYESSVASQLAALAAAV